MPKWLLWLLIGLTFVIVVKVSDSRTDFSDVDDSRQTCYDGGQPHDC